MVRKSLVVALATGTAAASALVAVSAPAVAQPSAPAVDAVAQADAVVAARPAVLQASGHDAFRRSQVVQSQGLTYAAYDRTYKGLTVKGGDLVIVTDSAGQTRYTSVAQSSPIGEISTTAKISANTATATAKKQLKTVSGVEGTQLIVVAAEGRRPGSPTRRRSTAPAPRASAA